MKKIWGTGWGHEKDILLACAAVIHKHQDQLWSIAQGETIREPAEFDEALLQAIPLEQQETLDDDEETGEADVDLETLWDDCLVAHDALWIQPKGRFTLSPNVSFVPNLKVSAEERYHHDKDFFIEYRFLNPERSLYFRLAVTTAQKSLLELFQSAALLPDVERSMQDFLRDMVHRKVLRSLPGGA